MSPLIMAITKKSRFSKEFLDFFFFATGLFKHRVIILFASLKLVIAPHLCDFSVVWHMQANSSQTNWKRKSLSVAVEIQCFLFKF